MLKLNNHNWSFHPKINNIRTWICKNCGCTKQKSTRQINYFPRSGGMSSKSGSCGDVRLSAVIMELNGWKEITSKQNLPPYNGGGKYECFTKEGNYITLNGANSVINGYNLSDVTHYRLITII